MTTERTIEVFTGKCWSSWSERLSFYFVANSITDRVKKRALLLTLCGAETFETVRALVAPRTPGDVSFEELVSALRTHFDPQPSEIYGRYKFQRQDQQQGESISSYVAALKKLAADCNFGIVTTATTTAVSITDSSGQAATTTPVHITKLPLDVMLRDRFVCAVKDDFLQQRLFTERDLTVEKAFELAARVESASKQQQSIKHKTDLPLVHKTSKGKAENAGRSSTRPCFRCEGQHNPSTCRCRNEECRYCNKRGHIEKACITKREKGKSASRKSSQHNVDLTPTAVDRQREEHGDFYHRLNSGTAHEPCPKFLVTLKIEGKSLEFEVDSGALCTLISEETYRKV
ncbi:uncharacterized protein LOC121836796 [Ixodes scapularis]|uniref:uncharacterized protein LOC121836796 n=1 Tax=Ixodes scapularis TaxID=6945 RepID=UPI001C38B7EF|nr:uncharacterized protein LOC121836796 [Ixodes scapularis]